jgi:hypothetical protein
VYLVGGDGGGLEAGGAAFESHGKRHSSRRSLGLCRSCKAQH